MEFKAFPSIHQFKDAIRNAKMMCNLSEAKPVKFEGTVKLHGSNGCVVVSGQDVSFQSRNREITLESDNCGMVQWFTENDRIGNFISENGLGQPGDELYIYGEICGGNIQKGVALTSLPKMFVVFDVLKSGERVKDFSSIKCHESGIYNIHDFPKFSAEIDFKFPGAIQNTLRDITLAVEAECPVGKYFGVSGVGEGVVWNLAEEFCGFQPYCSELRFKVKGDQHSTSKVKVLASVDAEKVHGIKGFLEYALTDNRLNQGLAYLREMGKPLDMSSMGDFLSWVFADILKEESDVMEASMISKKDIGKHAAGIAKNFYIKSTQEI